MGVARTPINRRTLLKGMGLGVAAVALGGTAARAATLGASPEPTWAYKGGNGQQVVPGFTTGAVLLAQDAPSSTGTPTVSSIDIRTGTPLWTWSDTESRMGTVQAVQTAPDTVLIASGSVPGRVTNLDPATGTPRWTCEVPGFIWQNQGDTTPSLRTPPVAAGAGAVFVLDAGYKAGRITAFDQTTGAQKWFAVLPQAANETSWSSTPFIGPGFVAVIINNVFLYTYDLDTGAVVTDGLRLPYAVSNQPVLVGDHLYLSYHAATGLPSPNGVAALALGTWEPVWTSPGAPTEVQFSGPTLAGGSLLIADSGGHLTALDPTTGATQWQAAAGTVDLSGSRIMAEDGIAYLMGSTSGATLYGFDLADQGKNVATFATGMQQPLLVGVQSGTCYYAETVRTPAADGLLAGGADLASVLHGFYAESSLMADGYAQGSGPTGVTPSAPTWRSHLQLLDSTGTPRVNKAVRVWTDTAATITSGGRSWNVTPTQPAWLATDAAGELAISVDATPSTTAASGRGIGCSALYVWGNFMEQGEAIVLYPDHDTMTSLSAVQGTTLTSSTSFDGTALLPTTYTPANADQLAQTIRGAMGAAGSSLAATQNGGGSYISFPGSTTNLLYQPAIGPTARTYVPSDTPAWSATFTGSTVAFSTGAASTEGGRAPDPGAGSIWTDFERFLDKVVHGVDKIVHIVWQGIKDVAQEIATAAGDVYKLVIDTVEKAAAVVAGILKTAVGDVERVVEALSFVFSWGTIVDVHHQISAAVTGGMTSLSTWASRSTGVPAFFTDAANTITADVASAANTLSGKAVVQSSAGGANPAAVYGMGGAKSYPQTRWMTEKVKQNTGQATMPSSATAAGSDFASTVATLISTIGSQLDQDFAGLPADLRTLFDDVGALARDPSHMGGVLLADVLTVIGDLVAGIVRFTGSVVGDALAVLGTLVDGVVAALTKPIDIPFLSDLYQWIAKSPLTILDLVSLIVAIPTTIVQQVLALAEGAPTAGSLEVDLELANVMALAVFTCLDPISEAFTAALQSFPFGFSLLQAANEVVILALAFPRDLATNTTADYVFWAFQLLPIVLLVIGALGPDVGTPGGLAFLLLASFVLTFYGIGMLATAITLGVRNESWRGKDGLLLAQNITSLVPNLFQLGLIGDSASVVTITVDAVCDIGTTGLAAAQFIEAH